MVASFEKTCALSSFQSQLVVASWSGMDILDENGCSYM